MRQCNMRVIYIIQPLHVNYRVRPSTTTRPAVLAPTRLPVRASTRTILWDDGGHFAQTLFESEVGVGARTVPPSREVIVRFSATSVELLIESSITVSDGKEVMAEKSKQGDDG